MLFVVILLLAIMAPLSFTVVLLSIDSAQSNLAVYSGERALLLAEGCVEDTLFRLRTDSSYSASDVSLPEGDCTISIAVSGEEYTVVVGATQDGYERTIQAKASLTPTGLVLQHWKEVSL